MVSFNIVRSMHSDRLSNLPIPIIESILEKLPVQEAARTSILSRQWRHVWASTTTLRFDDYRLQLSSIMGDQQCITKKCVDIVDTVLLQHRGLILKFVLAIHKMCNHPNDIIRWIDFLSRHGVEKLTLYFSDSRCHYKLPSHLFSCEHLRVLSLKGCIFKPIPDVNRLVKLQVLKLIEVTLSSDGFDCFISNCPLLKKLVLSNVRGLSNLTLHTPKLQTLVVNGPRTIGSVHFKYAQLRTCMIFASSVTVSRMEQCYAFYNLKELAISGKLVKLICTGRSPEARAVDFPNLIELCVISLSFQDLAMVSNTLWLIRNSPNLRSLGVNVEPSTLDVSPSLQNIMAEYIHSLNCECLESLKIGLISGKVYEMEFVKLMLATSPSLKKMTVNSRYHDPSEQNTRMLKDLLLFHRASQRLEIVFLDQKDCESKVFMCKMLLVFIQQCFSG